MDYAMTDEKGKYFIKWLEEKFDNLTGQIKENTEVTKEVRKEQKSVTDRLVKLEGEVFSEKKLPPFYRDPKVIQTFLYIALAFLLLVAAVTKFDIGAIL
ncbi:hypothetical protein [Mycolicibacterium sp. S3B2]|uniref:hypothetical protein n=1 Tax=Mycolicibacterium sp. S3B2 TaxID=3415120 RepID=UPI003C7CC820